MRSGSTDTNKDSFSAVNVTKRVKYKLADVKAAKAQNIK